MRILREHNLRRHLPLAAKVIVLAVAISICWLFASGQTSSAPIPSTLFGMHVNAIASKPWPSVPVGALGKGTAVTWGWIEPTAPVGGVHTYNWGGLDNYVNAAQNHGVSVFFSNDSIPQWAVATQYNNSNNCSSGRCNAIVANIADWDAFVTALVSRYKGKMIYELWNEPSLYDFDIGATPQTNYNDMVLLTKHMHDIVRSLDPGALIVAPSGVGTAYMDSYWAAGGTTDVDIVSLHAYYAAPESFISYVSSYRSLMAKYALSSKPLWNTEGSWGTSSLTTDQQIGFVARYYLLHWAEGISRFYWYQWDNPSWGQLWDATNGAHPAATAYSQIYNWMLGATMNGPCTQAGTVWTCSLTRANGYQALAVWNTAGNSYYTPPSPYTKYRDLAGNTGTVTATLSIGIKPILVETDSATASATTPVAALTVTPQSGTGPLTVTADSSGSYETGDIIALRSISFGDGTASVSSTTATHIYNNSGTYIVSLTVTDSKGASSSTTKTVSVASAGSTSTNTPPVAVLRVTPQSGAAPLAVTADGSGSYDPDATGKVVSWSVNFGDGSAASPYTVSKHTYSTPGAYKVTLTVTDNSGASTTTSQSITVTSPTATPNTAPVAGLTVTPQSGRAPLRVTADGSGSYDPDTNGKVVSWLINFGDGSATSSYTISSHKYRTPGTYTVTLTVTDNLGAKGTTTKTVAVY